MWGTTSIIPIMGPYHPVQCPELQRRFGPFRGRGQIRPDRHIGN